LHFASFLMFAFLMGHYRLRRLAAPKIFFLKSEGNRCLMKETDFYI